MGTRAGRGYYAAPSTCPPCRVPPRFPSLAVARMAMLGAVLAAGIAAAAPYTPARDDEVLETLPLRAADPRLAEINALRQALRLTPNDAGAAARLARAYYDRAAAEGDPRYVGYAQAALALWWSQPAPPPAVRVARALVLQWNHQFAPALADLDAVVAADPANGDAWAWKAAIHLVQAQYASARSACEGVARTGSDLIRTACSASVDSLTGRAGPAAEALGAALARAGAAAPPEERLWALTRLAEAEERRGRFAEAEGAYRAALALGLEDSYLLAALADFLLDRGRPAEVVALLEERTRNDLLLLRVAIAGQATGHARREAWAQDLAARFEAARLRGDATHRKEEARFALAVRNRPAEALALARLNWNEQKEPADARILLEAALAARDAAAAQPVLRWMAESRIESAVLARLAAELKALR